MTTTPAPYTTTAAGTQLPTGIQVGMGTKPMGVHKMFSQGDYNQTSNDLDLAIEGKGFFKVVSNDEEVYTRAGDFKVDSEGYMCNPAGDRLQPEITIPQDTVSISIDSTGRLVAFDADNTEAATAAAVPYVRSAGGLPPSISPMNAFRDGPTSTGLPRRVNS